MCSRLHSKQDLSDLEMLTEGRESVLSLSPTELGSGDNPHSKTLQSSHTKDKAKLDFGGGEKTLIAESYWKGRMKRVVLYQWEIIGPLKRIGDS